MSSTLSVNPEEEWTETREQLKEVFKNIGAEKACQKVAGSGKLAWRTPLREDFFSAKEEQVQAGDRRAALRETLWSIWRVDTRHASRMCEDRLVQVDASEVPCVSRDRLMSRGQVEVGLRGLFFFSEGRSVCLLTVLLRPLPPRFGFAVASNGVHVQISMEPEGSRCARCHFLDILTPAVVLR